MRFLLLPNDRLITYHERLLLRTANEETGVEKRYDDFESRDEKDPNLNIFDDDDDDDDDDI